MKNLDKSMSDDDVRFFLKEFVNLLSEGDRFGASVLLTRLCETIGDTRVSSGLDKLEAGV